MGDVAEGEGWIHQPASVNRREGPAFNVSYRPGEWQTYDIRLIGRVPQVHIDAAREGWRKSANDALSLSLMELPL